MPGFDRRQISALLLIALLASGVAILPPAQWLNGLSIDVLTWLRWVTVGPRQAAPPSPVAVVVFDEETYKSKPFAGTPSVAWTREIGRVVSAIIDGGARVLGFDVVFPSTIEQSEIPFGAETLGARLRGFDRDFLRAVASAAGQGKLVLGEVQAQERPLGPSDAQRLAVANGDNIRPLNLYTDPDGVVRRIPLTMTVDGRAVPSMDVELAARAEGVPVSYAHGLEIGGYRVPEIVPNTMTLNFDAGSHDIPTYAFVDLWRCWENGDAAYFQRHFAGRVVLLGVWLDLEDRVLTSKRFATGSDEVGGERCMGPAPSAPAKFTRPSIPGVYVHATAVRNLMQRAALRDFGALANWTLGFLASAGAVAAIFMFGFPVAVLGVLGGVLVGLAIAVLLFAKALVVPILTILTSAVLALVAAVAYRFMVTDKDKRLLRRNFAFYLAPALIEKMLRSQTMPTLGGEMRIVSLYRSDLAGFSGMSEQLGPAELVALMNEYLSAMTDIIGEYGGFVDKYVGDGIDGVFGAPVEDAQHALNAVKAALAGQARLEALNCVTPALFQGRRLQQRIGLHTGAALVGNIGSRQRFNYTVMGDAANLASRLEGANKFYGTSIIASAETAKAAGSAIVWRELDTIRVVGRQEPVAIFEPLAVCEQETVRQRECAARYALGLSRWRSADFAGAAAAFATFAREDPPAARFYERVQHQLQSPYAGSWTPVHNLTSK
ncbi:MAG TPA: adenylate/guanylate cyclase domain-containing protein [Hyphomicrobiaceae bacterium]|nr:adenylate/guanylate cyclase domain-containing protein [Hyphomicrobiaceae bacterium]